jgi:hypothetical protein
LLLRRCLTGTREILSATRRHFAFSVCPPRAVGEFPAPPSSRRVAPCAFASRWVPVDADLWLLTPHKRTRETRRLRSASERKKLSEYKLSARAFELWKSWTTRFRSPPKQGERARGFLGHLLAALRCRRDGARGFLSGCQGVFRAASGSDLPEDPSMDDLTDRSSHRVSESDIDSRSCCGRTANLVVSSTSGRARRFCLARSWRGAT